eukprot:2330899-Amphidinium_carterae.1
MANAAFENVKGTWQPQLQRRPERQEVRARIPSPPKIFQALKPLKNTVVYFVKDLDKCKT